MIFDGKGIVLVGVRNQRPTVNWPGVCAGTLVVAIGMAAFAGCGWYLLNGVMMPWSQLLFGVFFYTSIGIGCCVRRGMIMPVAELPQLDRSDAG